MITNVQIYDYVRNSHVNLFLNSELIDFVNLQWNKPDTLICGLSKTKFFSGLSTWEELRPIHYKFLILQNMNALPNQEIPDDHESMKSLLFLLGAFKVCLENITDSMIRNISVSRISTGTITYEYTCGLCMNLDTMQTNQFKVVVDNTEKEDNES